MVRRGLAALLSACVLLLSPGPGAYAAFHSSAKGPVSAVPLLPAQGAAALPGQLPVSLTVSSELPALPPTQPLLAEQAPSAVSESVLAALPGAALQAAPLAATVLSEPGLVPAAAAALPRPVADAPNARGQVSRAAAGSAALAADLDSVSDSGARSRADALFSGARRGQDPAPAVAAAPSFAGPVLRHGGSSASDAAPAADVPTPKAAELPYDIHRPAFRSGYLAAFLWRPGDAVFLPAAAKEREAALRGMAYRVAEVRRDAAAAAAFTEAVAAGPIESVLETHLSGAPDSPSLRANAEDADFAQGYLTAAAWRPGKQLWVPSASFLDRLNPFGGSRLRARDERFMEGLYAGLREARGTAVEGALRAELAQAPAVGSREFPVKLGFALATVLEPLHDKALDAALPFMPGKVYVPTALVGKLLGHHILIMLGIYMHVAAQPYLVLGLTGDKAMMGVLRNIHFGSYTASNFLPVGPTIDGTDYRTLFTGTSLVRMLLMGLIPVLFLTGNLTFAALAVIVALNPIFQNLMTNSDAAATASILGRDENVVREGTAFATKFRAIGGLVIPLIAAAVVGQLVLLFGDPGGYAVAYAGYAAMLLLAVPVFHVLVRDPRYHDPSVKEKPSRNPLNVFRPLWVLVKAPFVWFQRRFKKDAAADSRQEEVLAGARARERDMTDMGFWGRARENVARFFDRIEAAQGLAVILRSEAFSILVLVGAIEMFLADAMMMVFIPNYIVDVIHPQAGLAGIPLVGSLLATKAGIMGLMLTATAVGSYLGTRWASGPEGAARIKRLGHSFLYRIAAVGSLLFWLLAIPAFLTLPGAPVSLPIFFTGLGITLAMQFGTSLLHTPLMIAMSPVQRKLIPNDQVGKVTTALSMVEVALMAVGALVFGFLLDMLSIRSAVLIIAALISVTALLQGVFAPLWLGRAKPEAWQEGDARPSGSS